MDENQIRKVFSKKETTNQLEEETAWSELKSLGKSVVPYLSEAYSKMKKGDVADASDSGLRRFPELGYHS